MSVSIPPKHRAALMKEFGKPFSIEELPTPTPKGEEVLIKVAGAGICHSDIHVWKGDWKDVGIPPKLPFILSHEITGTVVAKGEKVPESVKIGQKVLVYAWENSEEDEYTIRGHTQLANKPSHLAVETDGGLREYFLIPHYKFAINAEGLEDLPAAAPLACAGLTTYSAVKKVKPHLEPGDHVLIVGLGGLGSYATQWIKALVPYANLIGVDVKEDAIEFAAKLSKIDNVINASKEDPLKAVREITKGKGVKVVIDLVGSGKTLPVYLYTMSKLGIYVLVGLMGADAHIPRLLPIPSYEWTITGSFVGTLAEQYEVVEAVKKGLINYKAPVTKRLKLEEASEGFEALEKGKVIGRQVVVFE